MPNTYTQVYVHFVSAVKYRKSVISKEWKEEMHRYITGIVQNNKHKMLAINSVADNLHMLVGLHTEQSLSKLMELVKGDSSEFINKKKFTAFYFQWQGGYGAFSNSKSQIDGVIKYIANQEKHHAKKTFLEEYMELLDKYNIDYDKWYIFKELE